jgi:hypothetical protein
MSDLTGQEIKETYKDLLHMNNGNTGVTSDLSRVFDGEGTGSALHLSDTEASVMGNLGVGTTSPSRKLQVHTDTNEAQTIACTSTLSGIDVQHASIGHGTNKDGNLQLANSAGNNQVYLTSNGDSYLNGGRVGIGTSSPSDKLEISNDNTNGVGDAAIAFTDQGGVRYTMGIKDGSQAFQISENSPLGQAPSDATKGTRFLIDTNGRVGIGTTSPSANLHVLKDMGSTNVDGSFTLQKTAYTRSSSHPEGSGQFMTHKLHELSYSGDFSTSGNNHLNDTIIGLDVNLDTNAGGQYAALFNGGHVGIGTASPSANLHVQTDADETKIVVDNLHTGNSYGGWIGSDGTSTSKLHLGTKYNSSFAKSMTIDSNGKVGINTTTPVWQLTVKDGHFGIDGSGYIIQRGTANTTGEYGLIHRTGYYSGSTGNHYGKVKINSIYNSSTNAAGLRFYTSTGGANSDRYVFGLDSDGTAKCAYDLEVSGNVTKGSGNFKIDHPLPEKSETHHLVHSFIEGPQADNIYRGKVELVAGKAEVNIDAVSGMTEGTFVALNRDIQAFTSNESDWDAVRGKVEGNKVIIECQNAESTATVSWLVIGERQDEHMLKSKTTDDNGKLIVEPLKPEPEPEYEVVEPEEVITEEPVAEEALVSIGASISGESLTEVSDSRAEEL